jgi:broad specificity phosphatase PhoE
MKYLILVKHSLPEIVESISAREWTLSEEGKSRAHHLTGRLKPYQPEVIISSAEPKAIQTAEIIAHTLGLPSRVVENIHEHDRSQTPFLPPEEFERKVQAFFDQPDRLVFGNETANQSHQRFREAMQALLKNDRDQTLIVVSHGTVISLFVSRLTGMPSFSLWKELGQLSYVVLDAESKALVARKNNIA